MLRLMFRLAALQLLAVAPRVTADQAATKWRDRMGASSQQITDGVNRVTTAPGQSAAAQVQKWEQKTLAARDKWARAVGRVTLAEWQAAMTGIGVQRVAAGASAKVGKVQSFLSEFLPYLQSGMQRVHSMPSTTLDDGIQRAVAMIRHNAGFKRSS